MNGEALPKLLSHISYFNGLDETYLTKLASEGKFVKYQKDSVIFKQDEAGSSLYIIILGKVKAMKNSGRSTMLDRLNCFGELSFFDGGPREITAVAGSELVLFEIQRRSFIDFLKNNPEAAPVIVGNLGRELRKGKHGPKKEGFESAIEIPIYDAGQAENCTEPEEMYYKKEFKCPFCGNAFSTTKVRSKYVKVIKMDDDLCNHYESVNPLFYEINVCPGCGYSFNDENSGPVSDKSMDEIEKNLRSAWRERDLTGIRSIEQAAESFKLAIICQMARRVKDSQKGMLYLKLGWLYRALEDKKNERVCLAEAVKFFTSSFEKEHFNDPKSEINIMYLIGVLNRIMGNFKEASIWLDRVLRHPMKNSYSGIVNRARDNWHILREEMKKRNAAGEQQV